MEIYFSLSFSQKSENKDILEALSANSKEIFVLDDKVFEKIAYGDRGEGVLAVCPQPQRVFNDLTLSKNPLIIVLEGLEKPGNLGAVFRTCDGAGVDAVIVCENATDLYNPNTIRASLGTIFSVPAVEGSIKETLLFLKQNNIRICTTLPDAKKLYTEIDMKIPLALVMGSEQKGLSDQWKIQGNDSSRIPMKGQADSLNVSVSTAVVLYEAIRQRNA